MAEENRTVAFTTHREGKKFWVNGPHNCLGRFSPNGWEIFRNMEAPTEVVGSTGTLAVRMHPTKPLDWNNFKSLMKEHHNVDISDEEYPNGE